MKSLYIAKKNLIEVVRNIKSTGIVFVLPIAFMGVFAMAFGGGQSDFSFKLGYVENPNEMYSSYIKNLDQVKNESGKEIFKLSKYVDLETAVESIENNEVNAVVYWSADNNPVIKGDTQSMSFNVVSNIFTSYTQKFYNAPESPLVVEDIIDEDANLSGFDYLVPGLIVYGLLILIPLVAMNLTDVAEKKYIFRYFTSKATSFDIIGGHVISLMVIALIQTFILYFVAINFGFDPQGSLLSSLLIAIPTSLFVVGLGLIIGGLVKKGDAASNLGSLLSIILGFFSGSFITGIENILKVGTINGREISLVEIIPSYHATSAMKSILLYGNSFNDVIPQFTFLVISSLIFLVIGLIVYNRNQLRTLD